MAVFITRAIAAGIGQKVVLAKISQQAAADMRLDLLERMMRQDGSFHQAHPPGFLIQRVQSDVTAINQTWPNILKGVGRDFVSVIVLMGVAVSVDWRWTLVALVGAPPRIAPSQIVQRFVRARAREARDLGARLATRLDEVFHGIIPVKLNRLEKYQSDRYRALTRDLSAPRSAPLPAAPPFPGWSKAAAGLGFIGVLCSAAARSSPARRRWVNHILFTAIGFAFEPPGADGGDVGAVADVRGGDREDQGADGGRTDASTSPAKLVAAPKGVPGVALADVHLAYGDTTVLNGATFKAEPGQTTALVGPSGAGKSTIFNLLTRLVDPQSARS
ncbi:MAG: ABC transporter ATP-binding protein [Paracoccaceae bacterium]